MYDKFGLVLRIETVINNPRGVPSSGGCTRDGHNQMVWCPMNKGDNQSGTATARYRRPTNATWRHSRWLTIWAPAYRQVEELTEPVVIAGRSHTGIQSGKWPDLKLFGAVLDGNHLVRADSNRRHPERSKARSTGDVGDRRRQSHAVEPSVRRDARPGVDSQSAPHPTLARQPERPSTARSCRATLLLDGLPAIINRAV